MGDAELERPEYQIAGLPLYGYAGYVGRLIMTNTRMEMALTQLRALHRAEGGSYSCMCGKVLSQCPSRAVILAFDKLEKESG